MKDDDLKEFANQFIQNWQDNFAKLCADNQIMELFNTNMHNMQQFYDKPASTTFGYSFKPGADSIKWGEFERRLAAIEKKLEGFGEVKTANKKPGAK